MFQQMDVIGLLKMESSLGVRAAQQHRGQPEYLGLLASRFLSEG